MIIVAAVLLSIAISNKYNTTWKWFLPYIDTKHYAQAMSEYNNFVGKPIDEVTSLLTKNDIYVKVDLYESYMGMTIQDLISPCIQTVTSNNFSEMTMICFPVQNAKSREECYLKGFLVSENNDVVLPLDSIPFSTDWFFARLKNKEEDKVGDKRAVPLSPEYGGKNAVQTLEVDGKEYIIKSDNEYIYAENGGDTFILHKIIDENRMYFFDAALDRFGAPVVVVVDAAGNAVGQISIYHFDATTDEWTTFPLKVDGALLEGAIYYGLARAGEHGCLELAKRLPVEDGWNFVVYHPVYDAQDECIVLGDIETYAGGIPSWW